jgi:hypothetical protein
MLGNLLAGSVLMSGNIATQKPALYTTCTNANPSRPSVHKKQLQYCAVQAADVLVSAANGAAGAESKDAESKESIGKSKGAPRCRRR